MEEGQLGPFLDDVHDYQKLLLDTKPLCKGHVWIRSTRISMALKRRLSTRTCRGGKRARKGRIEGRVRVVSELARKEDVQSSILLRIDNGRNT